MSEPEAQISQKKLMYGKYEYTRQYRAMVAMQWFFCAETDNVSQIVLMTNFCAHEYSEEGKTALMIAAQYNSLNVLRYLIQIESKMQNKYGVTALMQGAKYGNLEAVKILVAHEAGLSLRIPYLNCPAGALAMHVALVHRRDNVCSFLSIFESEEAGIPGNFKSWLQGSTLKPFQDSVGRTPLHYKVLRDEVEDLIKNPASYRRFAGVKDNMGRTALMCLILKLREDDLFAKGNAVKLIEKFITLFESELRLTTDAQIDNIPAHSSTLMIALISNIPFPTVLAQMEVGIINAEGKMASDYLPQYNIKHEVKMVKSDGLKTDNKNSKFDIIKKELQDILFGEKDLRTLTTFKDNQKLIEQNNDDQSTLLDSEDSDTELHTLFKQFDQDNITNNKNDTNENNSEQYKKDLNLIQMMKNDAHIQSSEDQLEKIQNILHVRNINTIYHGLQKLQQRILDGIQKESEAQNNIQSLEQQIKRQKQIIEENIAKNAPLAKKIKDLQKQLISLKGEFSIDNWTSMRDFSLNIATMTEKSNKMASHGQQFPEPIQKTEKEIQVQSDNGQVKLIQGIMNSAKKTLRSRKHAIENLKRKILLHKKHFLQTIDYVQDHYKVKKNQIGMHALTQILGNQGDIPPLPRSNTRNNIMRGDPLSIPQSTKASDHSIDNILLGDEPIPLPHEEQKAVIDLREFNELVQDAEVFEENLQTVHMETRNLEQILEDLKDQLLTPS